MQNLRRDNDQQQATQRFIADQAAREAGELDILSVYLTLKQWIANGEVERARAFWAAWKEGK